jgi:hypothetical protein
LSKRIWTLTPLSWALTRASAKGAENKENDWTRIEFRALFSSLRMASVSSPRGGKQIDPVTEAGGGAGRLRCTHLQGKLKGEVRSVQEIW